MFQRYISIFDSKPWEIKLKWLDWSICLTGPCAVELQNVEDTLAASEQPLLGLEKPNCDENGFYAGMQVIGSQ